MATLNLTDDEAVFLLDLVAGIRMNHKLSQPVYDKLVALNGGTERIGFGKHELHSLFAYTLGRGD